MCRLEVSLNGCDATGQYAGQIQQRHFGPADYVSASMLHRSEGFAGIKLMYRFLPRLDELDKTSRVPFLSPCRWTVGLDQVPADHLAHLYTQQ